jgi:hypothetical protein
VGGAVAPVRAVRAESVGGVAPSQEGTVVPSDQRRGDDPRQAVRQVVATALLAGVAGVNGVDGPAGKDGVDGSADTRGGGAPAVGGPALGATHGISFGRLFRDVSRLTR